MLKRSPNFETHPYWLESLTASNTQKTGIVVRQERKKAFREIVLTRSVGQMSRKRMRWDSTGHMTTSPQSNITSDRFVTCTCPPQKKRSQPNFAPRLGIHAQAGISARAGAWEGMPYLCAAKIWVWNANLNITSLDDQQKRGSTGAPGCAQRSHLWGCLLFSWVWNRWKRRVQLCSMDESFMWKSCDVSREYTGIIKYMKTTCKSIKIIQSV